MINTMTKIHLRKNYLFSLQSQAGVHSCGRVREGLEVASHITHTAGAERMNTHMPTLSSFFPLSYSPGLKPREWCCPPWAGASHLKEQNQDRPHRHAYSPTWSRQSLMVVSQVILDCQMDKVNVTNIPHCQSRLSLIFKGQSSSLADHVPCS